MFEEGEQVVTNQDYFDRFHRKVYGTVFKPEWVPSSEHLTIVRWDRQEGNRIAAHHMNCVIMLTRDLERDNKSPREGG